MRAGLLAALLFAACAPTQLPDRYEGVEPNAACTWNIVHHDRGWCISHGERLRCVRDVRIEGDHWWNLTSCVPYRIWK